MGWYQYVKTFWKSRQTYGTALLTLTVVVTFSATAYSQTMPKTRGKTEPQSRAATPAQQLTIIRKGSSSKQSQTAAQALALRVVGKNQPVRNRIQAVMKTACLYRELPSVRFEVDPQSYVYFTGNPDVAVSIWRTLGISKLRLQQKKPGLFAVDSGDGTKGTVELLFRGVGHIFVICNGVYKNPLLKAVKTTSLIHLQASFDHRKDGRTFVTHRAFLYVVFPSATMKTFAKFLSPMARSLLDRNFQEISLFLCMMSRAMTVRPNWMVNIAGKLGGIKQAEKQKLIDLTKKVHNKNRQRLARTAKAVSAVLPKNRLRTH